MGEKSKGRKRYTVAFSRDSKSAASGAGASGSAPRDDEGENDPIDLLSSNVHKLRIGGPGAPRREVNVEYRPRRTALSLQERRVQLLAGVSPKSQKVAARPLRASPAKAPSAGAKGQPKHHDLVISSDSEDDGFEDDLALGPSPQATKFKLDLLRTSRALLARSERENRKRRTQKARGTPKFDPRKKRRIPPALGLEDRQVVEAAFRKHGEVSTMVGAQVLSKDIRNLRGLQWINDEVITFYAVLINARSRNMHGGGMFLDVHCFNSFFYSKLRYAGHEGVRRWTRKIPIFEKDIVIVPINMNNTHWCCAAINIAKKRFEFYDSLGGRRKTVYQELRQYLQDEHLDKLKKPLDLTGWVDYFDPNMPRQLNMSDCGIFTCQVMETLSRRHEGFDFTQNNMPYFRQKMVLEIVRQELILEPFV